MAFENRPFYIEASIYLAYTNMLDRNHWPEEATSQSFHLTNGAV